MLVLPSLQMIHIMANDKYFSSALYRLMLRILNHNRVEFTETPCVELFSLYTRFMSLL
jgi:hypothetical protein